MMAAGAEVEVNGGSEYPGLYKVMMDKLNEQRQLDQFTDITLIVDGMYSCRFISFFFFHTAMQFKKVNCCSFIL